MGVIQHFGFIALLIAVRHNSQLAKSVLREGGEWPLLLVEIRPAQDWAYKRNWCYLYTILEDNQSIYHTVTWEPSTISRIGLRDKRKLEIRSQ